MNVMEPMRRKVLVSGLVAFVAVFGIVGGASQPVCAQTESAVALDVLNEPIPGTNRIMLVHGDPVEVYFEVEPAARTSPSDQIQLRRVDDGDLVSHAVRGEELSGTVSLSTTPENALGWLEVSYVLQPTGVVLTTSEEKVLVVAEAPPEPPSLVVVPSEEAPTIQAGIIAVADGGTVEITEGVYEILQPIFVIGKSIAIEGAGSSRKPGQDKLTQLVAPPPTEVVAPELALGVINYLGAGGVLKDLDVSGSDACVVTRDLGGTAEPIVVQDVRLSNTGRGMLCKASADLTVQDAAIHDCLWNGISFAPEEPAQLVVTDTSAVANSNIGFLAKYPWWAYYEDVFVAGCNGGIVIINGWLMVVDSVLANNSFAGICLHESYGLITDNIITFTHPVPSGPLQGYFGDGVDAFLCPDVTLTGNHIGQSARAGVANFGSTMYLGSNDIQCAGYELEYEEFHGVPGEFVDLGGNECGCPIADGWCVAETAGLAPPEPTTPIE
jgi:hypothetical protein